MIFLNNLRSSSRKYKYLFNEQIYDVRQIEELRTMRFLENAENIVFLGPPGVGKTHLATALGMETASHRFSTYYINCHALIEQIKKHISRIDCRTSSRL